MSARHWKRSIVVVLVLSAAGTAWPDAAAEPIGATARRVRLGAHGPSLAAAEPGLRREVHRLCRHLDAVPHVPHSTSNPFAWAPPSGRVIEGSVAAEPPRVLVPVPQIVPAVPITRIGVAMNHTGAEPQRFAILDWSDEPVIAAEGARIGGRYIVRRIEAGAIEVAIDGDAASAIRRSLENN